MKRLTVAEAIAYLDQCGVKARYDGQALWAVYESKIANVGIGEPKDGSVSKREIDKWLGV